MRSCLLSAWQPDKRARPWLRCDLNHEPTAPKTHCIQTAQLSLNRYTFRKKIYQSVEQLQADLDAWIETYNDDRPHSGRYCYGKMPMQTFNDSKHIVKEKTLNNTQLTVA